MSTCKRFLKSIHNGSEFDSDFFYDGAYLLARLDESSQNFARLTLFLSHKYEEQTEF